jgi:hypothetical protein
MCIVLNADMKKEAINFEIKLRRQITREKLGIKPWYQKTLVSGYNFSPKQITGNSSSRKEDRTRKARKRKNSATPQRQLSTVGER